MADAGNVDVQALFNRAMQIVENSMNNSVLTDQQCGACIETGGVVNINLAQCSNWLVNLTEDIGQFNIYNGDPGQGFSFFFQNPTNLPKFIQGLPSSLGGGSRTIGPGGTGAISGRVGQDGKVQSFLDKPFASLTQGQGGGGVGATLVVSANVTSICVAGKGTIQFTIAGGTPPYTVKTTAGVITIVDGSHFTLTPSANGGASVSGDAYQIYSAYTNNARITNWGCNTNASIQGYESKTFGCNDQVTQACKGTIDCGLAGTEIPSFSTDAPPGGCVLPVYADQCTGLLATLQYNCDRRTGTMITNGCNPCGIVFKNGAVVTVTDKAKTSVVTAITI